MGFELASSRRNALAVAGETMEATVRIDHALAIAGRARIRRRTAAPSDAASERVAPSSERPSALRDSQGRFLKGLVVLADHRAMLCENSTSTTCLRSGRNMVGR